MRVSFLFLFLVLFLFCAPFAKFEFILFLSPDPLSLVPPAGCIPAHLRVPSIRCGLLGYLVMERHLFAKKKKPKTSPDRIGKLDFNSPRFFLSAIFVSVVGC